MERATIINESNEFNEDVKVWNSEFRRFMNTDECEKEEEGTQKVLTLNRKPAFLKKMMWIDYC